MTQLKVCHNDQDYPVSFDKQSRSGVFLKKKIKAEGLDQDKVAKTFKGLCSKAFTQVLIGSNYVHFYNNKDKIKVLHRGNKNFSKAMVIYNACIKSTGKKLDDAVLTLRFEKHKKFWGTSKKLAGATLVDLAEKRRALAAKSKLEAEERAAKAAHAAEFEAAKAQLDAEAVEVVGVEESISLAISEESFNAEEPVVVPFDDELVTVDLTDEVCEADLSDYSEEVAEDRPKEKNYDVPFWAMIFFPIGFVWAIVNLVSRYIDEGKGNKAVEEIEMEEADEEELRFIID